MVGFDDSPSAAHTDPPLTTVHQPVEAMGREMVRLLLARIGGGEVDEPLVVLPTHLVVRPRGLRLSALGDLDRLPADRRRGRAPAARGARLRSG